MADPTVSVLMTAYNRERYIAEAIESVLAQTFRDFELVVVDDSSKDKTVEIARQYASEPRMHLHVNEKNLGDYPNRNRAAGLARGRYLKYLDSDDMMYPHCLEIMVHQMDLFPEAALAFTKGIGSEWYGWLYPVAFSPAEAYRLEYLGCGALDYGPTFSMLRRETFLHLGGFQTERMTSDVECSLRLARQSHVLYLTPGLVFYRSHPHQESAWGSEQLDVCARYFRIRRDALLHPQCPLGEAERELALQNVEGLYLRVIARDLLQGRLQTARKRWQYAGLQMRSLGSLHRASRFPFKGCSWELPHKTITPNWRAYPMSFGR